MNIIDIKRRAYYPFTKTSDLKDMGSEMFEFVIPLTSLSFDLCVLTFLHVISGLSKKKWRLKLCFVKKEDREKQLGNEEITIRNNSDTKPACS